METIKNRFIYYKHYKNFERDLDSKIIANDSIVFIEDSNTIWANNHEYKCGAIEDSSAVKDIQEVIGKLMPIAFSGNYKDLTNTPTIDTKLSATSTNALTNKAIYEALQEKASKDDISDIYNSYDFKYRFDQKQDKLTAGYGIDITNNIIRTTLDTSVYEIVDDIYNVVNPNPNKIYLQLTEDENTLIQYMYVNGEWRLLGSFDNSIDFSIFYTKNDIDNLFYNKEELGSIFQTKKAAIEEYEEIWDYLRSLDFSPYITEERIKEILDSLNFVDLDYINNNFVTLDYLKENFVNWVDVYTNKGTSGSHPDTDDPENNTGNGGSGSNSKELQEALDAIERLKTAVGYLLNSIKPIAYSGEYSDILNTPKIPVVDKTLSPNSDNAIANNAVYSALQQKASKADVENVFNSSKFITALAKKQDILSAGPGISINNNVISSTLDTSVFEIIYSFDEVESPSSSKIYILYESENEENKFTQYVYRNGNWYPIGEMEQTVNLSGYYTKSEADDKFYVKGELDDLLNIQLDDYYTKQEIDEQNFVHDYDLEDYYTKTNVDDLLKNKVTYEYLEEQFVNWKDVYKEEVLGSRPGGGVEDDNNGGGSSGGNTNVPSDVQDQINNIKQSVKYLQDNLKPIAYTADYDDILNTPEIPTTDLALDRSSRNPIANDAVTEALSYKQDALRAGTGIKIENNVISSTVTSSSGGPATNMVTLTVSEYQALVDQNLVEDNVYYFTYSEKPDAFVFGGSFPITLS